MSLPDEALNPLSALQAQNVMIKPTQKPDFDSIQY